MFHKKGVLFFSGIEQVQLKKQMASRYVYDSLLMVFLRLQPFHLLTHTNKYKLWLFFSRCGHLIKTSHRVTCTWWLTCTKFTLNGTTHLHKVIVTVKLTAHQKLFLHVVFALYQKSSGKKYLKFLL